MVVMVVAAEVKEGNERRQLKEGNATQGKEKKTMSGGRQ